MGFELLATACKVLIYEFSELYPDWTTLANTAPCSARVKRASREGLLSVESKDGAEREEERLTRLASCRDALDTLDLKAAAENFAARLPFLLANVEVLLKYICVNLSDKVFFSRTLDLQEQILAETLGPCISWHEHCDKSMEKHTHMDILTMWPYINRTQTHQTHTYTNTLVVYIIIVPQLRTASVCVCACVCVSLCVYVCVCV